MMQVKIKSSNNSIFFIGLALVALLLFLLDLLLGSVDIPFGKTISILFGDRSDQSWAYIILSLRLPRAITALFTGAGLAVAGLLLQTLFRNPLAGPYVLGISSGASLGVALFVMSGSFFSASWIMNSSWGQVTASVAGSVIIFLLIIAVSGRVRDSVSLLIVGIMFGALTTAAVSVLQYFSKPELVQKFVIWTMGSLSSTGWPQLSVMVPVVTAGIVMSVFLIKPLNAWLLGENNARVTGVPVQRVRLYILVASSLIAGALTAFTGPVAFVGLAVPHLVRFLFGTSNHRILIPGTILSGTCLLLVCDIISQVPGQSLVFPINAVTALFGAPVVLWIILGQKKLRSSF